MTQEKSPKPAFPPDFFRADGPDRPECWMRDAISDCAWVFQIKMTARDLRSLAKWCVVAAEYIEWHAMPSKNTQS